MRGLLLLISCSLGLPTIGIAQSDVDERSNILYVIGRVASATETSCLIDIGNVQTVTRQNQLAVFRPVRGYYEPIGRIRVIHANATSCDCRNTIQAQPNDIVMTVREISQLHPGPRHRRRTLRQHIVRSYQTTASSTFNNIRTANGLSHYQQLFPKWERSRAAVAGTLMSESLQDAADERLDRLKSQLNLMRRRYQQDTQIVAAAGEPWDSAMSLLAGRTAAAGHALRVADQRDNAAEQDDAIRLTASELRSRVFDRVFQLEQEQQNTVAFVIASLLPNASLDNSVQLRTSIAQTQFPDLEDDDQLLADMGRMLLDFRILN